MRYLAILFFVFINACQQTNITESVVFDNNRLSKISINVNDIEINKIYKAIYSDPYIDHSLINPPIQRLENWIYENVKIFGKKNKLEINIIDASIKKLEVEKKDSKKLQEKNIFKYELFYLVEYNLLTDTNYLIASTIVESKQTTTSGKHISILEKEKITDKLIWNSLQNFSNKSESLIKKYMKKYIL